jgi:hypothetical protein
MMVNGTVYLYKKDTYILWPNHQLTDHQAARNFPSILVLHGVNRNFGLRPSVPGRRQEVGVFDPGRPAQRHPGRAAWAPWAVAANWPKSWRFPKSWYPKIIQSLESLDHLVALKTMVLEIRQFENLPYGIILPVDSMYWGTLLNCWVQNFWNEFYVPRKVFMRYTCLTHTVVQ